MNSRERLLAIILILVMAGAAGAAGFWQLIWTPYKKHDQEIAKLQKEIAALEVEKHDAETTAYVYETKTKKKSLPADINFSRKEYARLLGTMLRKAEFDAGDIKVSVREQNTTDVPTLAPKKPAYTKLEFDVTVRGDLLSLVDFLYHFYRQPLLHQIVKITVVKPSGGRGRGGDLDVTLLVQAIVLDKAEDRSVLLATPPSVSLLAGGGGSSAYSRRGVDLGLGSPFISTDVLARTEVAAKYNVTPLDEYRRIAGKNIFHGPAPTFVKKKEDIDPKDREIDLAPYLALILVHHNDNGAALAVIYDRYRKEYYEVEQDTKGAIRTSKFYYNNEVRKKANDDAINPYNELFLTFGREDYGNERSYRVRRILESDIIIEPYIQGRGNLMKYPVTAVLGGTAALSLPGTLYSWHVGQVLHSEVEGQAPLKLSAREARQAMLRALNFEKNGVSPAAPISEDPKKKDSTKKRPGR